MTDRATPRPGEVTLIEPLRIRGGSMAQRRRGGLAGFASRIGHDVTSDVSNVGHAFMHPLAELYAQVAGRRKRAKTKAKPKPSPASRRAVPGQPFQPGVPALSESGQYGAPFPGHRRIVTGRDVVMNKRLEDLNKEDPFGP